MDITAIDPDEQGRRIRAALGYANVDLYNDSKSLFGRSEATMRRRASGAGARSMDELYRIADVCGVPRTFMDEGWSRYEPESDANVLDRLRALERVVMGLARPPTDDAGRADLDDAVRQLENLLRTLEDEPQSQSHREQDDRPGTGR